MSAAVASTPAAGTGSDRWLRYRRYLPPLLIVVLWQMAASAGLIPTRTLASPAMIAGTFAELISTGELPRHLLVSLGRVATGLGIGIVLGTTFSSRVSHDAAKTCSMPPCRCSEHCRFWRS